MPKNMLHKEFFAQTKEAGDNVIEFVASDETIDRDGDIIRASGWDLKNYKKNPVVLLGHDYGSFPIGKAPSIRVEDKALIAPVEFALEDSGNVGEVAFKLAKGGFLRGMSVGFRAIAKEEDEDVAPGYIFTKQELFEVSIVTVPANPNALARGLISEQEAEAWNKAITKGQSIDPARVDAIEAKLAELADKYKAFEDALKTNNPNQLEELAETLAAIRADIKALKPQPSIELDQETTLNPEEVEAALEKVLAGKVDQAVKESLAFHLGQVS